MGQPLTPRSNAPGSSAPASPRFWHSSEKREDEVPALELPCSRSKAAHRRELIVPVGETNLGIILEQQEAMIEAEGQVTDERTGHVSELVWDPSDPNLCSMRRENNKSWVPKVEKVTLGSWAARNDVRIGDGMLCVSLPFRDWRLVLLATLLVDAHARRQTH